MKIYINENYEIKAINKSENTLLKEIEVDREKVFEDKSDFIILNYCYKPNDNGYSVYPAIDYNTVEMLEANVVKKISILEAENKILKQELSITQDAVNELIFNSLNI